MNKEKKLGKERGVSILTLVVIALIVVMVIIILVNAFRNKEPENVDIAQGTEQEQRQEHVQALSDGSKLNKSEELQKTKKINGLEIRNIQLRETGGITTLLADVKNTTNRETEEKTVKVDILDRQGNVIIRLLGPIDSIPAGGTGKLNVAVTADVANAYDFRISE